MAISPRLPLVWEKQLDEAHARLRGVSETEDCGIFTVGFTNRPAPNNSNNEGYYLKLKAKGER